MRIICRCSLGWCYWYRKTIALCIRRPCLSDLHGIRRSDWKSVTRNSFRLTYNPWIRRRYLICIRWNIMCSQGLPCLSKTHPRWTHLHISVILISTYNQRFLWCCRIIQIMWIHHRWSWLHNIGWTVMWSWWWGIYMDRWARLREWAGFMCSDSLRPIIMIQHKNRWHRLGKVSRLIWSIVSDCLCRYITVMLRRWSALLGLLWKCWYIMSVDNMRRKYMVC